MRVADARNVFAGRAVLHGERGLVDNLPGARANDVRAQEAIRVFVAQDLDQTVRVIVGFGARICREREFPHRVFHSLRVRKASLFLRVVFVLWGLSREGKDPLYP